MQIDYLANHPEYLPTLSQWVYDEWGHNSPGATLENVEQKFRGHLNHERIPLTLIALENDEAVGTASLLPSDLPSHRQLSPWLAAVYVPSERRGDGIGKELVKTIEAEAHRLGYDQIYLFTPDQEIFYARLDWETIQETYYRAQQVSVMRKDLP